MLHTAYTITDVYDWDRGLTPAQIEYLVDGIREQEEQAFALQIQLWTTLAPLWASATNFGFTGNPAALNSVSGHLRDAARALTARARPAEADDVADEPPPQSMTDRLMAHPMFAVNRASRPTVPMPGE